jgi:hypothetical protein
MNPREFEAMNRQHGNHTDQTVEEATRLLLQLITNIEEDISPNEMSRHLKDVLSDAKQFLGIDIDSEYTFKVIAEEWQIDGSAVTETDPMTLYVYMPKNKALSYWKNQTVWREPEEGDNFASVLEGPYVRLAEHVNECIWEQQSIKVIAYSHISIESKDDNND